MTHKELVEFAARWLRGTRKCALVATERGCFKSQESPDAIGWTAEGESVLVEAKTSIADFLADAKKPHRQGVGMGVERWFITEGTLLAKHTIPGDWGLLEVRWGRVYRTVPARRREILAGSIARAELPLLVQLVRRTEWAAGGNPSFLTGITITGESDVEAA